MNRTIIVIAVGILLIAGVIIFGVLYVQESGRLDEAEANIVSLEDDLAAAQVEVDSLEDDLAAKQAEIASLEDDLAAAQAEVTRLEGELATAEGEISGLEDDLAEAQAEVDSLEDDLAVKQAEVASLEDDLAAAQAEVSSLETDLAAAQAEVADLSDQLAIVRNPRHFSSVAELEDWLAQDDTEEVYADANIYNYVYILQTRALRDGYLLPTNFEDVDLDYYADAAGNMANIQGDMYLVWPFSDEFEIWIYGTTIPSHPLPIE